MDFPRLHVADGMTDTCSGSEGWNRNTHYHDQLLAALPVDCRRVLDVGCGLGTFARRLARVVEQVDALDRDPDTLTQAVRLSRDLPNVRFVEADFLAWQPETPYDAVSMVTGAVATVISAWYRAVHRSAPVGAPIAEPQMTLREISNEGAALLPGLVIRSHALLRYSLIWTKP